MEELDLTAQGQLLELCLKTIQEEAVDAKTMMGLLGLVNLTQILELVGGKTGAVAVAKPPVPTNAGELAGLIPAGTDKNALMNNLMGMLGGDGDFTKLLPLVSMLGSALKSNQGERSAVKEESPGAPPEPEPVPVEHKESAATNGWARVGR